MFSSNPRQGGDLSKCVNLCLKLFSHNLILSKFTNLDKQMWLSTFLDDSAVYFSPRSLRASHYTLDLKLNP